MAMHSRLQKILKRFHPEGIPFPGTKIYNAVSQMNIFQRHYDYCVKAFEVVGRNKNSN
jgi:hypothetical protein